jgi:membrane protein DedA with SNARE-associated domain
MQALINDVVQWCAHLIGSWGLPAVFVLMLLESACIPIPSEATMPFAGFAVSQGHLSLFGVVAAGVAGNLVGSWIAYAVGYWGGPPFVERYGRYVLLRPGHLEITQRWFDHWGAPAVFFSRMVPIVRTFVSLPAGFARMAFWKFTLYTVLGCLPWVLLLAFAGERLGRNWEKIRPLLHYADYAVVVALFVLVAWAVVRWRRGPKHQRPRRRFRLRWLALAALVLLSPAIYSYTTTMLQPSSLPLKVRSVEWLRAHHGNWLVDEAEHVYYSWTALKPGGPQLKALPTVGIASADTSVPTRLSAELRALSAAWPPPIKPVFAKPLPSEGIWHRTGPLVGGRAPVLVATFRTERDYPRIVAYLAWFDHTLTSLAWYAGRYEPPKAPVRGPMMVPPGQRRRLLATFNGGFIYTDGHNGSSVNGRTYEPLKDGLATLVGYSDGRVDIKRWSGGPNAGPGIAFARQSLPLIISDGRLNPALNDSSQWGFTLGNAVRVWRTGAGIDRRGNLIYAAANDQTVISLARILQRAGAVRAMQLDINPFWPTLITYSHHKGLDPTRVAPNLNQPATRYLVPDDRDFFAVYRRLPGPVIVPLR